MNKKLLWVILAASLASGAFAQNGETDAAGVAEKKETIARVHQHLYRLPYPPEYVTRTVMTEIRSARKNTSPHYPEREAGKDPDAQFETWIASYPGEFDAYIRLVESTHRKYASGKQ